MEHISGCVCGWDMQGSSLKGKVPPQMWVTPKISFQLGKNKKGKKEVGPYWRDLVFLACPSLVAVDYGHWFTGLRLLLLSNPDLYRCSGECPGHWLSTADASLILLVLCLFSWPSWYWIFWLSRVQLAISGSTSTDSTSCPNISLRNIYVYLLLILGLKKTLHDTEVLILKFCIGPIVSISNLFGNHIVRARRYKKAI